MSVTEHGLLAASEPESDGYVHVLLVEDEPAHAELVSRAFKALAVNRRVTIARSVREARACLAEARPDVIIANLLLPDGKGTDLLAADPDEAPCPVVIVTGCGDEKLAVDAMKAGATDYLVKSDAGLSDMPHVADRALREWRHVTRRKRAEDELRRGLEKLQRVLNQTVDSLGSVVEKKDPCTAGHQQRTASLARAMAVEMGLSRQEIEAVHTAAVVHDVGKVCVPAEILIRPGKLSDIEYALIQTHPKTGYDILKGIEFSAQIADIVLGHHERLDGSGYPAGPMSTGILFEARILGVADVVETMTSCRPYRPPLCLDVALAEISQKSGRLYDPAAVEACAAVVSRPGFRTGDD